MNMVFYLNRRLLESQLAAGFPIVFVGYHVFSNHFVQSEITIGHGFHMNTFALSGSLQLVDVTVSTPPMQRVVIIKLNFTICFCLGKYFLFVIDQLTHPFRRQLPH